MSVPKSFTYRGNVVKMTFAQQNELDDAINKYKKEYSKNKNMTPAQIETIARERANTEMKRKLFSPNK